MLPFDHIRVLAMRYQKRLAGRRPTRMFQQELFPIRLVRKKRSCHVGQSPEFTILPRIHLILLFIFLFGFCQTVTAGNKHDRYEDFSEQAKEFIKVNELPITSDFESFSKKYLKQFNNVNGKCCEYKNATHLFLVDLQKDGKTTGLIMFTVESNGIGNSAYRDMLIFTKKDGKWSKIGSIELGTLMTGWRSIIKIQNREIETKKNLNGTGDEETSHDETVNYKFEDGKFDRIK